MKHPETAALAKAAMDATGLKTEAFADLICVGKRTLFSWLSGEKPASGIAQMVLREVAAGWRPSAGAG